MYVNVHRAWFAVSATFCVLLLAARPADAGPIKELSGQYVGYFPFIGVESTTFTLTNGGVLMPTTLLGLPLDDLLVDVTPYSPKSNDVILTNLSGLSKFTIFGPSEGVGSSMVVWDIANPSQIGGVDPKLGIGKVEVRIVLDPKSPGIPGFNQDEFALGLLTIEFFGIAISDTKPDGAADGLATWTYIPGSGVVTGRVSIRAIPEPAAHVTWIVGAIALVSFAWCRRKRRHVTSAALTS